MPLSEAAKNAMLEELATLATHAGLADDGTELSGGSPAYARQELTWDTASGGVISIVGTETFNVEGGDTVNEVELWSASSNGTKYGTASVTEEVFGGQGTYTINTLTVTLSDPA